MTELENTVNAIYADALGDTGLALRAAAVDIACHWNKIVPHKPISADEVLSLLTCADGESDDVIEIRPEDLHGFDEIFGEG